MNFSKKARWRVWALRVGPWVIAAAVMGFLLQKYSLQKIAEQMAWSHFLPLFALGMGKILVSWFLVCLADWLLVRALLGAPGYLDLLRAKASSAWIDLINYQAGHAGYALWLGRKTGAEPTLTISALLYIMSSDLTTVCAVAAFATFYATESTGAIRTIALSLAGILLCLKITGPLDLFRGRGPRIFRAWVLIDPPLALIQIAIRILLHVIYIAITWWAMQIFGLRIPFWVVASSLPITLLVASLPLNIAGFGTVQAVWLLFFQPYAAPEQILAFQFSWTLVTIAAVFLRGLPFIRRWLSEIEAGKNSF